MAAKLTRKLNGARERRERWRFDIRLTQCDGLGELDKTDLGSGEVCVQLARHAKVAPLACTMRSSIGVVIRPTVGLPRLLRTFNSATRQGGGQPVRRRRRRQSQLGGGRCALARVHAQAA